MKINKLIVFFILFFSGLTVSAQSRDSLKISLITCSPGEEVYELFGHTAIRVQELKSGIDIAFHYGLFNFNAPNFLYRFTKGETDYSLGVVSFPEFIVEYALRNSGVTEQDLNLSPEEARRLFDALMVNYEPQNRIYRYNFLFDNCSTRPRNIIADQINGCIKYKDPAHKTTFRKMIHHCTRNYPWLTFGIDLALGSPLDTVISYREEMFLPSVLMDAYKEALVIPVSGKAYPLVSSTKELLISDTANVEVDRSWFTPLFWTSCFLLLIIVLSCLEIRRGKHFRAVDTLIFILYGLVGSVLFFLMFVSTHPTTYPNYSAFWAHPFHLLIPVLIWVKYLKKVVCYYHFANFALLFVLLLGWYWIPQQFNPAFLPLALVLIVRSATYIWIDKKRK